MELKQSTDETLMLAYQQGEVAAFAVLLERHRRPVFAFLLRHVGNRAAAEDLLQETFLRLIRHAESYRPEAKLTTWIYTIARNLCADHGRRGKLRAVTSLDQPLHREAEGNGPTLGDAQSDDAPDVERVAIGHELGQRLHGALGTMNAEQREVFLLREVSGLAFREIAEVVGAPENTVKSRMRYALEYLRRELDEYRDLAQASP